MPHSRWRLVAWTALLAVTMVSFVTVPPLPELAPGWIDKLAHAGLYAILMLLFAQAYPARQATSPAWFPWLRLSPLFFAGFLALWGCGIEWLQGLTAHRSASAADVLANITGIIIAAALHGSWRSPD